MSHILFGQLGKRGEEGDRRRETGRVLFWLFLS